jgi:hypothetical protein
MLMVRGLRQLRKMINHRETICRARGGCGQLGLSPRHCRARPGRRRNCNQLQWPYGTLARLDDFQSTLCSHSICAGTPCGRNPLGKDFVNPPTIKVDYLKTPPADPRGVGGLLAVLGGSLRSPGVVRRVPVLPPRTSHVFRVRSRVPPGWPTRVTVCRSHPASVLRKLPSPVRDIRASAV